IGVMVYEIMCRDLGTSRPPLSWLPPFSPRKREKDALIACFANRQRCMGPQRIAVRALDA
ncbi:hypothetical protein, partial [Mesorhizobium sp. M5C.F.Ca.IN.020.32.2.1]|uniref:hypothetical protein n=1 Tax=Mesorhizobium sp. M5C.F.Ca.IN.020.32.2.1 TaxID=2496771 RepID=UPI0019D46821